MIRWGRFAAAYACMGVMAWVIAVSFGNAAPLLYADPWLELSPRVSHIYSLCLGVAFGALVVVLTRPIVAHFTWAQRLHSELRPIARDLTPTAILLLAILSALGEELLFRGLLLPALGLVPQALVFGLLHQIRGASRWVWVAWASVIGLFFGAMFQLTGSLVGPIVAHGLINGLNLLYLKTHDPAGQRPALGGLLGQEKLSHKTGQQPSPRPLGP